MTISRLALLIVFCGPLSLQAEQAKPNLAEPLPISVATNIASQLDYDLSPDGKWIAYDYSVGEKGYAMVAPVGSNTRTQITEWPLSTGFLGKAAWSPNGKSIAFYTAACGDVAIALWSLASRATQCLPNTLVSASKTARLRWFNDSERFLALLKPEHELKSAALQTARTPSVTGSPLSTGEAAPAVIFRRAAERGADLTPPIADASLSDSPDADAAHCIGGKQAHCDLSIVNVRTRDVLRLIKGQSISWYAVSPDQRFIAYTIHKGWVPNTQQGIHDLAVIELSTLKSTVLKAGLHLHVGDAVSWSPDSHRLAYVEDGPIETGRLSVVDLNANTRTFADARLPGFAFANSADGVRAPLWNSDGTRLYVLALEDGTLWAVDATSGRGERIVSIARHKIHSLMISPEAPAISAKTERALWIMARNTDTAATVLFTADVTHGRTRKVTEFAQRPLASSEDASVEADVISYIASDQQHPDQVWFFSAKLRRPEAATALNSELENYALGKSRLIHWQDIEGRKLSGTVLLPPSYRPGTRLPLVVWLYGGESGSAAVNAFGLVNWSPLFNFHILATRGYAVLFPDAPLRVGQPVRDLLITVMPGVNQVIEEGIADPDRLAVMGQSYGSYSTLALITQTSRFKAAVISAVLNPNILSEYLLMSSNGRGNTGYFESGQGRMGGSLWEYPQRYIENSPIYSFDRIETPLLIGQGVLDSQGYGPYMSDAVFTALQRLGKEVDYCLYPGEGHVISKPANMIDFWNRRIEFLSQHLNLATHRNGSVLFADGYAKGRTPR